MRSSPSLRLSPPTCTWLRRQHVGLVPARARRVPAHAGLVPARAGLGGSGGCQHAPGVARRLVVPRPRRGGTDRRELRVGGEKTSLGGDVEGEKKEIELTERSGAVKINNA